MFNTTLKFFLYLVLSICILWGATILFGPTLITKFLERKYGSSVKVYDLKITPSMQIYIKKVDLFNLQHNGIDQIDGYIRAVSIRISNFTDGSLTVSAQTGPAKLDKVLAYKSASFEAESGGNFEFDFFNIKGNLQKVDYKSLAEIEGASLEFTLETDPLALSDIGFEADSLKLNAGVEEVQLKQLSGKVGRFNVDDDFDSQFLDWDIIVENVNVGMGRYLSDDLSISSDLINGSRVISINSQIITDTELDIRARDLNITFDLDESREFTMGNLRLEADSVKTPANNFLDNQFEVDNLSLNLSFPNEGSFVTQVEGKMASAILSIDRQFIGDLSGHNFVFSSTISTDSSLPTYSCDFKLSLDIVDELVLEGDLVLRSSDRLFSPNCYNGKCNLGLVGANYQLRVSDQAIFGESSCTQTFCQLNSLRHQLKTSNSEAFFARLSSSGIINPVFVFMLFGEITSGQKIGDGHIYRF